MDMFEVTEFIRDCGPNFWNFDEDLDGSTGGSGTGKVTK